MRPDNENDSTEVSYLLTDRDRSIVEATKQLLWKIVRSELVQSRQLEAVARVIRVFDGLPDVDDECCVAISLTGPRRHYGEHEIYHWWNIEVDGHFLTVSSHGHFYRPSSGGDSFTCMTWSVSPGYESEYADYLNTLRIVDDAQPFEAEVARLDLSEAGYSLTVSVDGEEIEALYEDDDFSKDDLGGAPNDEAAEDFPMIEPCDDSERTLSKKADEATGRRLGEICLDSLSACDLCERSLADRKYVVNGRLRGDLMWAYMCSQCFLRRGEGLGWGNGQLYSRQPNGDWLLVAGFPPEDDA